jgi:hypothetical protein
MDAQTETALARLYYEFRHPGKDFGRRWETWIHENLNQSDYDPTKRSFSVQLVLRRSIAKIVAYGTAPLVVSLAIGFWYQFWYPTTSDSRNAIIQTAWTTSSYIIALPGNKAIWL